MHKMATNQPSVNLHADEDYIDMELSSSSNFLCYFISSPPQTREFEFQMTSMSRERESTTSPADELFYKGKLLPLNLPTRLQMVRKILQSSSTDIEPKTEEALEEKYYSSPFIASTGPSTADSTNSSTPLDSQSCRFSSEVSPDECFLEWSIEKREFIGSHPKKSWAKKLKQIKQFALGQKLKASSSYLKTLFSKSGCSDASSSAKAACTPEAKTASRGKDCLNKFVKVPKKNPFGKLDREKYQISSTWMKSTDGEMLGNRTVCSHRRSFSGVIQLRSDTKSWSSSTSSSGSSSFSFGSSGFNDLQLLKRLNCSMDSQLESSIDGAIAHCKQSQQLFSSSKVVSDVASKNELCWDQERRGLCII
ncbi:probable membrane-associated kinase regulator 4 [Juglans microcarpa x Juglans regia]|uniref:probable membrane-associated kinase regulator 4 n=1 Tax=Juglans microcarpa x Juglans regia TaxID=2249226 RepID=UPI001B7EBF50|nr:probable membrane-associated kinase regulator 4 [Juglans microcarpa x Juglans regia]